MQAEVDCMKVEITTSGGTKRALEGAQAVRQAYGANYARLAALKAQFDPKNLFRRNQNISLSAEDWSASQ
jgi:FAD/FMN-containing dehydrogenase